MTDVQRALLGDHEAAQRPIILDLCGGSGSWSKPYKEAGYDVRLITLPDYDVLAYTPPENVYTTCMGTSRNRRRFSSNYAARICKSLF